MNVIIYWFGDGLRVAELRLGFGTEHCNTGTLASGGDTWLVGAGLAFAVDIAR